MAKVRVVLVVLAAIFALSFSSRAWAQAKLLGDNTGWAFRVGLQWTNNDGEDWQTVAPRAPGWSMVNAFFLNTSNGWALLQKGWPEVYGRFAVASTDNHGLSWSVKPVNLPSFYQGALSGGGTIDFLDPMHGWVNLGMESMSGAGFLFSTDDGGETWHRVKGVGIAGEVRFITPKEGWVGDGPGHELYGTHDGGKTWEKINLPPPPGLGPTSIRNYYLPTFQDPSHGYLPVSFLHYETGGETFVLFQTADGGKTWDPTKGVLQCPGCSGPVPLTVVGSALFVVEQTAPYKTALVKVTPDGRVERLPRSFGLSTNMALSFLTPQHGWLYDNGNILVTTDGGETWTNPSPVRHGVGHRVQPSKPIQPPQSSLRTSGSPTETSALAATATTAGGGQTSTNYHTSEHLGYDSTQYLTAADMATWWTYSPYYDVGVYLGGTNTSHDLSRTFPPPTDKQWVTDVVNYGWGIIPIWFGTNPYCTKNPDVTDRWPSTKSLQDLETDGTTQAGLAENEASNLGLGTSVIYYDMENWDTNDATCNQQVASFLNGWVTKLKNDHWQAGVYTSTFGAEVLWNSSVLTTKPDDIWVGRYDEHATIWGLDHEYSGSGLADTTWGEGFRAHQYLNSETSGNDTGPESYGGVLVNPIDRDIEYAQVAGSNGSKSYTYTAAPALTYPGAVSSFGSGINDSYQGFLESGTTSYAGQIAGTWYDGTINHGYAYDPYTVRWDPVSEGSTDTYLTAISDYGFTYPSLEVTTESFGQAAGWYGQGGGCNPCGAVINGFLDTVNGGLISANYNGGGTAAAWSEVLGINDNCQNSGGCQASGTYGTELVKNGTTYCYYHHGYVRPRGGATSDTAVDFKGATGTFLEGINGFGQAVGYYVKNGQGGAFVYDANTNSSAPIDVSSVAACSASTDIRALAINNNEQVLIWCNNSSNGYTTVVYDLAHPSSNPPIIDCGGTSTMGRGINDSGEVVGSCIGGVDTGGGFIAWPF